ncbi:tetratricopeptide repeat protein [Dactylosporangium aurantiacum]|uniref:Tetratricopeptide repeat protein n=1 Tax=Dactylosporangium aurantiacum TaxID=35754 RepID=A0A9Q9MHL7_9ACTN|nr:BTAD domain-containing putative transcriptional regulator [Dactylosporangium aurantiacum]MDG6101377.1 BTAD domain-containing putative transcriptional regulator [Dactylosporangium aurantiacum]UWZ52766.1 tetratricopeptide repeat protein [Dactylosporangium aurantiacum]
MIEFNVLGPLTVSRGGKEIRLHAPMLRRVLAVLLCSAGRPVPVDVLIDSIWEGAAPPSARKTLQIYIRRLRQALDDDQRVRHTPAGYAVLVSPGELDEHVFAELAAKGRAAHRESDLVAASACFADALALWRAAPYADITGVPLVTQHAQHLEEQRLAVVEDHVGVELELGRHLELVADLTVQVKAQPYRERLREHLMLALYRAGRQAEALEAYRQGRALLADELGVEPATALQWLHEAILRSDPTLELVRTTSAHAAAGVPAQLPPDVADFTGRAGELDQLDAILDETATVVITAITGSGGIGKTALAVHWAHRVRDRFPDGQLYLNLHGYSAATPTPPLDALGRLLRDLGVPAEQVPDELDEAIGAYRSLLADRRVLVLLDNANHPDQIRPLLPGGPGSLALITSRDRLSGLVARDGARRVVLDVLAPDKAVALLSQIVGDRRIQAESSAGLELAGACCCLPLALRIAAAHLVDNPHRRVADYLAELRAVGRMDTLRIDGDGEASVRDAFDHSYTALRPEAQRLFRLLGLVPGPDFTAAAAAALAGAAPEEARRLLDQLTAAYLVEQRVSGRYALHDLLRDYAKERVSDDIEQGLAQRRLYDWYLSAADAAARSLYPQMARLPMPSLTHEATGLDDPTAASAFFDTERPNLVAAIRHAAEHGPPSMAWLLTDAMRGHFWHRREIADWLSCGSTARAAAAAAGAPAGEAAGELALGNARHSMGDHRQAAEHLARALTLCRRAQWTRGEIGTLNNLGLLCCYSGRLGEAERYLRRVLELADQIGTEEGVAAALTNLGLVYLQTGRLRRAVEQYTLTLAWLRRAGGRGTRAMALVGLGSALAGMGQVETAMGHLNEALALHRAAGSLHGEATALVNIADVQNQAGQHHAALDTAAKALAISRLVTDLGNEVGALRMLGTAHRALADPLAATVRYREAIELSSETVHGYHHAAALSGLSLALVDLRRPDEARTYARRALAISRAAGYRLLEADTLAALSLAL